VTDSDGASGSADPHVLAIEVTGLIAFGRADAFTNDASHRMFDAWGGARFFPAEQTESDAEPAGPRDPSSAREGAPLAEVECRFRFR